ncbi:MAG TPA: hypothetical protein VFY99_03500 [Solirubrobacterales bacterium]
MKRSGPSGHFPTHPLGTATRRARRAIAPVIATAALSLLVPAAAEAELEIFQGLNSPGLSAGDNKGIAAPPDTTGAIGPDHFVEVVNVRIAVYARSGLESLAELDANEFWELPPAAQTVDPQLAWDERSGRWYYVMLLNDAVTEERAILYAWSKTADPTDLDQGWCKTRFSTGKLFDDYPKLGFSRHHVLIGTNLANLKKRKVLYSRLWAIAKPPADGDDCTPPEANVLPERDRPLRDVGGPRSATPVPAVPVGEKSGFVVAAECLDDGSGEGGEYCGRSADEITVWRVVGPAGEPRLKGPRAIHVPRFRAPKPVHQPGAKQTLDALDGRLTQAVSSDDPDRGGSSLVWSQHTVARKGGRSAVRWYALDPQRLRAARRDTIAERKHSIFNGAIAPTLGGTAIVNYNVGGETLLPQIRAQEAGHPASEITLGKSVAPDRTCDPPDTCSWGDYAGASTDPRNPDLVWGANQTIGPPSQGAFGISWRTRIFALRD